MQSLEFCYMSNFWLGVKKCWSNMVNILVVHFTSTNFQTQASKLNHQVVLGLKLFEKNANGEMILCVALICISHLLIIFYHELFIDISKR